MGITTIYEDLYMGWIKTWTLGIKNWSNQDGHPALVFFHVEFAVNSPHPTHNTPSHCHHCHWIGYRSYAMVSWCFMNPILDPKKYPKSVILWWVGEKVASWDFWRCPDVGQKLHEFPCDFPSQSLGARNTWHRRSWTSHMSTMRRPSLCDLFGAETFWWLIGNQPYITNQKWVFLWI